MSNAVFPLFAYPVAISGNRYEFSSVERDHIAGLEMVHNTGNSMSSNDTVLDHEALAGLRSFIEEALASYKRSLLRMTEQNEIYITQSWINVATHGQHHPRHKHPNSVVSGVLFLDENADRRLPPLRFHRTLEMFPLSFEYEELTDFNATCRTFDPEQGMLILFPSLLEHDVEANPSQTPRTSLSFNTFVRGPVGNKALLTALDVR